jgi:folate-binding protein YgfZ
MKIPRDAATDAEWTALEKAAVVHQRAGVTRYELRGTGALACLQGLVTSDLVSKPDQSRTFGALLTAKGMIVSPLWIERRDPTLFGVEAPEAAGPAIEEIFAKSLPPRLCTWQNLTAGTIGIGLYGPKAETQFFPFPSSLPAVARGARGLDGDLEAEDASMIVEALVDGGAVIASHALMATCRILAGIPALGAEIDGRTLPQEVRMEELGAISYTKGCYLGQETVARLHFRGHANRRLVLLVLDGEPAAVPADVSADGKPAGRLTSACWSRDLDAWVAQALLRREVEDGAEVDAGGTKAVVRLDRWLREP